MTETTAPPDPAGVPERHITLEGAVNFRDIGGYTTAEGRQTRWRTVFRADGLSRLTPADLDLLRELGVATVVDLRTAEEVERGRFPVDQVPVDFHHVPFVARVPDPEQFKLVPGMLASHYQEMAQEAAGGIAGIVTLLADPASHPAVVHCTAGKDRTGVLVAVLLSLLGVPDRTVVADYALSALAMDALRAKLIERYPEGREVIEAADEMFSADPSNIAGLLDHLRSEHGSVEAFVAAAGADADVQAALRQALLD